MNIALIVAGGRGNRMHQDIPKQFLHVMDKPLIIYTLEAFQRHPDIEMISVVCLDGWQEILRSYAKQFNIKKLKLIIEGGQTVQESIRNGIFALEDIAKPEDIIIIHDSIRPFIEESVISDAIVVCRKYGNAISSLPYNEQIFKMKDQISTQEYIPRDTIRRVVTPQAYIFSKLFWAYKKAFTEKIGIQESSYTNTMMVELGETLYFSSGSEKNIKITTKEDLEIFKALLIAKNSEWIK